MSKTVLITGGAGFIGSHLCRKYLESGHRVICVDNLQTTLDTKNIEPLLNSRSFTFLNHDIIEPLSLNEPVDWIFNFACSGSYTIYQYDPIHTIKTSTIGMMNMLELADMIVQLSGSHSTVIFQDAVTDDPRRRVPDITLAYEKLRWKPMISLTEGLQRTIASFQQNSLSQHTHGRLTRAK